MGIADCKGGKAIFYITRRGAFREGGEWRGKTEGLRKTVLCRWGGFPHRG